MLELPWADNRQRRKEQTISSNQRSLLVLKTNYKTLALCRHALQHRIIYVRCCLSGGSWCLCQYAVIHVPARGSNFGDRVGGNVKTQDAHVPSSCNECTITLEDVQLQLGLLVDGPVVTGSIVTADWRDVYEQLLGRVSETIYRSRIYMNWFRRKFGGLNADSSEVQREQYAREYILMIIGGLLMLNKSQNLVHLRWLLKLVDFREVDKLNWGANRVGDIVLGDVTGDETQKN
ncbi:serine/threonine-protein phosphatase 7 long form-like protein [Gossypium australe]|uniref:Serine/threonine-protein phosphatase 7 long form-like protein n=1 Tax=Gossypium australe TaxID=47621 RepID=A0A5B6V1E4_9ROSI|nr:serine/threonine-protein phosphatase 7 long form-like protein [Gossypium australe]